MAAISHRPASPRPTSSDSASRVERIGAAAWPLLAKSTPQPDQDNSSDPTGPAPYPIGFAVNFFGHRYSSAYINNNGNITFDAPLSQYTPSDLSQLGTSIIAPFFADVDTRGSRSNVVNFGTGTLDGQRVFVVNWPEVGCFSSVDSVLNDFQLVLIDRPDLGTGASGDDFQIEFNYGSIEWDTGQASGGDSTCINDDQYGTAAFVGYSDGSPAAPYTYESPFSGIPNAFLNSNHDSGLVYGSQNSGVDGRYIFTISPGSSRNGTIQQTAPESATAPSAQSALFLDQLDTSDVSGPVTFVTTNPSSALAVSSSGQITTTSTLDPGSYTASGTDSDPYGNRGTWTFTLNVTSAGGGGPDSIIQTAPMVGTTTPVNSSTFTSQLATTGQGSAVTFTTTATSSAVSVSSTGFVSTTGSLAVGNYRVGGTDSDEDGDTGIWSYILEVTSSACPLSVSFGPYLVRAAGNTCLSVSGTDYSDSGAVTIDGVSIVPNRGDVTFDTNPSAYSVAAEDANVDIGGFEVYSGEIPTTSLMGSFTLPVSNFAMIGSLPISGNLKFSATSDDFTITGTVSFPDPEHPDDPDQAMQIGLTIGIGTSGLESVGMSGSNLGMSLGAFKLELDSFSASYDWVTDTWNATATVNLPGSVEGESQRQVMASIELIHGAITQFLIEGDHLNIPFADSGVFLNEIGADIDLVPSPGDDYYPNPSISGTVAVTAGPELDIDGTNVALATVAGSLAWVFSNPAQFIAKGTVTILTGTPVQTTLASGEIDYDLSGSVTVSGTVNWGIDPVSLTGQLSGFASSSTAYLNGTVAASIGGWQLSSASGVLSQVGIAACAYPFGSSGPSAGFGYTWSGVLDVMYESCSLGAYQSSTLAAGESSNAAGSGATVVLPENLPIASFTVVGQRSAPSIDLVAPGGHRLIVRPSDQGVHESDGVRYAVAIDAHRSIDYVLVDKPAGGRWTVVRSGGSAIERVRTADGLPTPHIHASVSGTGLTKTLNWTVADVPGQRVTFIETAPHVGSVIVANVNAGNGALRFTPSDGPAATRRVFAVVTLNGLVRTVLPVARFRTQGVESLSVLVIAPHGKNAVVTHPAGIDCTSRCTGEFLVGTVVRLTALPAKGFEFLGWLNGPCSGRGACVVTLREAQSVEAKFGRKTAH